jgi:hypothetical protein
VLIDSIARIMDAVNTSESHLLPEDPAARIARELWWTSQEFSPACFFISP